MKISIITVSFNAIKTIEQTINSVLSQNYKQIEYIIVDGASDDGTIQLIQKYSSRIDIIISEHDNGMYDALNKGIRLATGDIIGILNSDDYFCNNNVLNDIAEKFCKNLQLDAIIGDVAFINADNKIIRYCSGEKWNISKFKFGNMPPHPSFYCKTECFNKFGYYKTEYKIAGDFELLIRFFYINKINYSYISIPMVYMRLGGLSTSGIRSIIIINQEIRNALKINGISTNLFYLYSRYFRKIFELKFNLFSFKRASNR